MKKSLRIAGFSIAGLLVLAAGLLVWALHTESGARSVLALARGWFPAALTVGEVRGTIGGTLRVTNFRYHDPGVGMDLQIENAELEFSAFALLARRISVQRAVVDGVRLALFPGSAAPATPPPVRNPWVAPIDMAVDELRLTRGELRRADAAPLVIQRAHVAGSWTGASIVIEPLEFEGPDGQAKLAVRIAERAPKLELLRGTFRWRIDEHYWTGALDAEGGSEELRLNANLDAPVTLDLAGSLAVRRRGAMLESWRAKLAVSRFDPHPLLDTEAFKTAALEFDASGDRVSGVLQGVLSLDGERVIIDRLAATRHEKLLDITALRLRLNSQPAVLTGTAKLPLDGSGPASAQLEWDEFHLPDAWMGKNFRSSGRVALTAAEQRYAVVGKANLSRGKRHSTLALRLDGSDSALRIQEFELTQQPGALSIAGEVEMASPARWQLDATARQFDPSLFAENWPGSLDFQLRTTGQWPESGPRARFELPRLAGRLRGRAISGSGDVTVATDRQVSGDLHLQSGGASLAAVASAGSRPHVDATLKIAALQEWHQQLSGALEVSATATGRWPGTQLNARLHASGVRSGGTRFDAATVVLDARDARAPRGSLRLNASGVAISGLEFDLAEAKLDGDAARHEFALEARGERLSFDAHAAGGYQRATWSGVIDRLGITAAPAPPLALREPARLVVARNGFELDTACLAGGEIALCAGARQIAGELAANYSIKAFPLTILKALAAPDSTVGIEGVLEGGGDLRRAANGSLSGSATLASPAGAFTQGKDRDALRLEYRDFGIDIDLTPAAATARLRGVLPRQGDLSGSLSIAVAEEDPSLAGEANLKLSDLEPISWWMPQLANLRGSGEVAARVGGTVAAPRIAFLVRGTGLDAEVPVLGVHLRDGNVDASLEPDGTFQARGSIASGDGSVQLDGGRNAEGALELRIAGSNFLAASIPGARVVMAPDLALSGKIGDLLLTGAVKIEDADVNLEKLSIARTYRASTDVVVVDREFQVRKETSGLTADVRVILGERVKIAGFGIDANVSGELRVIEARAQPSRATGEIRLAGTYEAFGRKLQIERGKLTYAGSALDDPQLDILAVRKLQDVTAKLAVTGTAQNPKLDVFADPAMSQTDAMSYLLTGKPASDVHGEDGAVVQSATQNVGILLGNRLTKKFGGKVGIVDEMGVEQNADLGGSAFTVGKYLSPKLFVSYGVGLFEPGNAITVRYKISERWSLEANDTPEDQHAGVRYRIEK